MIRDLFERKIARILKTKVGLNDDSDIVLWMESHSLWASKNYESSSYWIDRLLGLIRSEEDPCFDTFYILMAGLVSDLPMSLESKLDVFKKIAKTSNMRLKDFIEKSFVFDVRMKNHILLIHETNELLKNIVKTVTDDERSKILYLRNKYSHPVLDDYKVKIISGDNQVFSYDQKKYLKFSQNRYVNEIDLLNSLKAKLVAKNDQLEELSQSFLSLRY